MVSLPSPDDRFESGNSDVSIALVNEEGQEILQSRRAEIMSQPIDQGYINSVMPRFFRNIILRQCNN